MDLPLTDRIAEAVYSTFALLAFVTLLWLVIEVQEMQRLLFEVREAQQYSALETTDPVWSASSQPTQRRSLVR